MLPRFPMDAVARLTFLLVGLMCAGCVTRTTTNAERKASMKPYEEVTVGSEPMHNYIVARSAFLIGAEQLKVLPAIKTAATYRRNFRVQSSNVHCGTASAIRSDGYFLTAAHNIQGAAPHLAFYQDGRIQFYRSRVVWRGDVEKREPDLAVLHVPTRLKAVLKWAPQAERGMLAFAGGLDCEAGPKFKLVTLSGQVSGVAKPSRFHPGRTTIFHRSPVHVGDSGGPLVTDQGKLLGINVELRPSSVFRGLRATPLSVAHRPDIDWLNRIIAADAAEQGQSQ
jgi:S1-C subfamily serine protease